MYPKRTPVPTLQTVLESLNDIRIRLEESLNTNLSSIKHESLLLQSKSREAKRTFAEFRQTSRDVMRKLAGCGATEESEKHRLAVLEMKEDINSFLTNINSYLRDMNLDLESEVGSVFSVDCFDARKNEEIAVSGAGRTSHNTTVESGVEESLTVSSEPRLSSQQNIRKYPDGLGTILHQQAPSFAPLFPVDQSFIKTPGRQSVSEKPSFGNQHMVTIGTSQLGSAYSMPTTSNFNNNSFPVSSHRAPCVSHPPVQVPAEPCSQHTMATDQCMPGSSRHFHEPEMSSYHTAFNNSMYRPGGISTTSIGYSCPSSVAPPVASQSNNTDFGANRNSHDERRNRYGPPPLPGMDPLSTTDPALSYRDPIRYLSMRNQLFEQSKDSFSGDPTKYNMWVLSLRNKVANLPLQPLDILQIIKANTTGEPRVLVEQKMSCSADPLSTLNVVWAEIHERFGSGEQICESLCSRCNRFIPIKGDLDVDGMRSLLALSQEIQFNMCVSVDLATFNTAVGQRVLWEKLPARIKSEWCKVSVGHKTHLREHPPLSRFIGFLEGKCREIAMERRWEPFNTDGQSKLVRNMKTAASAKTETERTPPEDPCDIHENSYHTLTYCRKFRSLTHSEKLGHLRETRRCLRCLGRHSTQQLCQPRVECEICCGDHHTLLHRGQSTSSERCESKRGNASHNSAENYCAKVCGSEQDINCSKVLLVDINGKDHPEKKLRCYCIIDEQSSSSFIDPKVVDFLNLDYEEVDYELTTLNGLRTSTHGRLVKGLYVEGVREKGGIHLPPLFTNDFIPDSSGEVATPDMVKAHKHIAYLAGKFSPRDPRSEVLLLIGRDCGPAMATKSYGYKAPYAHHTSLGWALVGSVCKRGGKSKTHTALKINLQKEHFATEKSFSHSHPAWSLPLLKNAFLEQSDDELPGNSKENDRFFEIVSNNVRKNENGNIVLPLPFKREHVKLPDNRQAVLNRTFTSLKKLRKTKHKLDQCIESMQRNIDAGHVEVIPPEQIEPIQRGRAWWIPVFPVTHPRKDKVRLVFDSSATYHGTSLNQQLLQGPDINNSLRSVLIRFRNGCVGFSADIERMFHAFHLEEEDRDFTRFYWFADNNPSRDLVQYRARVHIFGNCCSPTIANLGLRIAAALAPGASDEVLRLVNDFFYVDDALGSADTEEEVIEFLSGVVGALATFNIRLCKIASNSRMVVDEFSGGNHLEPNAVVELGGDKVLSTLGMEWKTTSDELRVRTDTPSRTFTKRGVLSSLNSFFDPLGFLSPVLLAGRILQRTLLSGCEKETSWDDPLPSKHYQDWVDWRDSLVSVGSSLSVKRSYYPHEFGKPVRQEIHSFSDASEEGIGYVTYIRSVNKLDEVYVAFVAANSKIAPKRPPSVPRLELCAALEAAVATRSISEELEIPLGNVSMYCDSKVVLGYLANTNKRFSRYITRRVNLILKTFGADHWKYIQTEENPADLASRACDIESLRKSVWFTGPSFLSKTEVKTVPLDESGVSLPEMESRIITLRTDAATKLQLVSPTSRTLEVAIGAARVILQFIRKLSGLSGVGITTVGSMSLEDKLMLQLLIRSCQKVHFPSLMDSSGCSPSNRVASLDPFVDDSGVLRVGGRLENSSLRYQLKHPILLSPEDHLTRLIITHYHVKVRHQGRVITLSAIREAGYYVLGESSIVKKVIKSCFVCRRLRGKPLEQKMSDLPADRLSEAAPFSHTGLDVFGPFSVTDGKTTRSCTGGKKVWAVIFTCLVSRAVHIEPLASMDTSSMKNALRRFLCLRGACVVLRSDQGTNFVGVRNLEESSISLDDLRKEISLHDCQWILNPPKASHFGGVWERKIGSIRRILDAALLQLGPSRLLSRDEFHTLLQEAANIINNTPLWDISHDLRDPYPLTPASLLTMKGDPLPMENVEPQDVLAYGPRRWRRVQAIADQFWSRWRREYLQRLQPRSKWSKEKRSLQPGDIVLVKDKNVRRNMWPIGRVSSVRRSKDNLVRSAIVVLPVKSGEIKTVPRMLERPIVELVLLRGIEES